MFTCNNQIMNIFFIAREFYSIIAVEAIAKTIPFVHSHDKWLEDFNQYKNDYIDKIAQIIYEYTVCAVVSELRNCKYSKYYMRAINEEDTRKNVWSKYTAESILKTGTKMFDRNFNTWSSNFGGNLWKLIAKAGLMYGHTPNMVFVDHCIDLCHNCGSYFNKRLGFFILPDGNDFIKFLDDKKHCSLVEKEIAPISIELQKLIERGRKLNILPKNKYYLVKKYECEKYPLFVHTPPFEDSRWELKTESFIPSYDDLGNYDFFDGIKSYTPITFGKKDLTRKRYYKTGRY